MSELATMEQYQASADLICELSTNTAISVEWIMYHLAVYIAEVSRFANDNCINTEAAWNNFEGTGRQEQFFKEIREERGRRKGGCV